MTRWFALGCIALTALLGAPSSVADTITQPATELVRPAPVEQLAPIDPGKEAIVKPAAISESRPMPAPGPQTAPAADTAAAPAAPASTSQAPTATAAPAAAPDAAAAPAAPAAPAGPDAAAQQVWWGNHSVAFGNYIKFDRITDDGSCEKCDKTMHDCDTGLPCTSCKHICEDCNDCPPTAFEKIFFDLDKSVLRPKSIEECEKVLTYLNANASKHILIEGHCCDLASDAYNMALGQRRADAVKTWLVAHGVAADRIATKSYGERQPWVGIEHRELNRRAIVVIVQ